MEVDGYEFSQRLRAVGEAESVMGLRKATMVALDMFDIQAAYFLAPLSHDLRVSRTLTSFGFSEIWERHYREGLWRIDGMPQIALARLSAFCWPDQLEPGDLSKQQQRYLKIAAQYGLGRGIAVPCFGPGGRSGFLGAALKENAPSPSHRMMQQVQALGQSCFQSYCRLILDQRNIPPLSKRELEVLHWISRGKSNSVIAELLGISPSSVDVYVRRIFAKLDVTDRTTASVKAYSLGLLVTSDYERFVNDTTFLDNQEPDA